MLRAAAATRAQVILRNIDDLLLLTGGPFTPLFVGGYLLEVRGLAGFSPRNDCFVTSSTDRVGHRKGGSEILRGAGGGEMSETQRLSRLRVISAGGDVRDESSAPPDRSRIDGAAQCSFINPHFARAWRMWGNPSTG